MRDAGHGARTTKYHQAASPTHTSSVARAAAAALILYLAAAARAGAVLCIKDAASMSRALACLLLAAFALLAALSGALAYKRLYKGYDLPPYVSSDHATLLYECLVAFDDFARRHELPYVICGGAWIGALRNDPPGPLFWDDDLDVAMLAKHWDRFEGLLRAGDHPFEWSPMGGFQQLRLADARACASEKTYHLDVLRLDDDGEGGVYCKDFPKLRLDPATVDVGAATCELWGRSFPCPNVEVNPEYDEAGREIVIWSHAHRKENKYPAGAPATRVLLSPLLNGHIAARMRGASVPESSCWKERA